jgi:predicted PurR-regulated permease PerM
MQVIDVVLTFYLLFYFLRDRRAVLLSLRSVLPLSKVSIDKVLSHVGDTIHATIYGTLTVAAVQGTLGGLMFWWLGLPAPVFWGLVMAVMAVVPVLGAFIVWMPAVLFLVLEGSWGKALVLAVWGGVVVGGIDNVLYPVLVGNRLKLHTIPAFMAIVGGLFVFGSSGLILGPVTLTVTLSLLEIWRRRTP